MVYYPLPMHLQKAYIKYKNGRFPNSEILAKEVLSLPMFPDMDKETQEYIISNLQNIL